MASALLNLRSTVSSCQVQNLTINSPNGADSLLIKLLLLLLHITSHHTTLHYITLICIALHYITLLYITSHHITSHCITQHYITSHHIPLHYITLHHTTSHYIIYMKNAPLLAKYIGCLRVKSLKIYLTNAISAVCENFVEIEATRFPEFWLKKKKNRRKI